MTDESSAIADVDSLVGRYTRAWNETDPSARRSAVEEIWTGDGTYRDPRTTVVGHEAIDGWIAAVQERFPGFTFTVSGDVDAHHDVARIPWELGPAGGAAVLAGIDVAVLTADGRIRDVYGFFDTVPG